METKTVLKTKSFSFCDNSRILTTEFYKARIIALLHVNLVRCPTVQFFVFHHTLEYYLKIPELLHLFQ